MRIVRQFIFVTFALLVATALADEISGQRKLISSREYYQGIYQKPDLPWYERTHHVETTREELNNGAVTKSYKNVSESVVPDREREYTKTIEGDKVTELERITIENWLYTRKDRGPWKKIDLRQQGLGNGTGSGSGSGHMSCSQYSVESVFLSGISVKRYEWIDIFTTGNELAFWERRNWLSDEGLPYREEEVKGSLNPRVETWKEVVEYDYSPDIKIEAPIN